MVWYFLLFILILIVCLALFVTGMNFAVDGKKIKSSLFFSSSISLFFLTFHDLGNSQEMYHHQPSISLQIETVESRVSPDFSVLAILPYDSDTAIWGTYPGKSGKNVVAGYQVYQKGKLIVMKDITKKFSTNKVDQCFLQNNLNGICENFWKSDAKGFINPVLYITSPAPKPWYSTALIPAKTDQKEKK